MSINSDNQGSTLIEILIAAFILTISLVALVSLTTLSIARNRMSKEKSVATRLAQEGMDWMIAERNTLGYDDLSTSLPVATYCINDFETRTSDECTAENNLLDLYKRELIVSESDSDKMIYKVKVYWGEGKEVVMDGSIYRRDKTQ